MSPPHSLTRRRTLRLLSSLPLLSTLPARAAERLAAALRSGARLRFGGMPAPSLADPRTLASTWVASTVTQAPAGGDAARAVPPATHRLAYETFFLTGQRVPDGRGGQVVAGGCHDIRNRPIPDPTAPGGAQLFSDCPDGMSLIALPGRLRGRPGHHRVFAVVQFEYTSRNHAGEPMYGQLPSPIAVLSLDQDERTGALSLVGYHNVDTSGAHGLWITCGASLSPWGTHLSSEEYEPDAVTIERNGLFRAFSRHLYGDPDAARPYHYGHVPEVTVHPDGSGSVRKHYCLGRISHELVQVMPDERTVLMGDDWTNGGLFMFVADRPRDLSAGTLYVARWTLDRTDRGGAGRLRWIRLGHAASEEIERLADTLRARDIVDVRTEDPREAGYVQIAFAGRTQWVRFVPGRERAAAFLETHRYAAAMGGSMVFTKMEGTTLNARDKVAYTAMSGIRPAMARAAGLDEAIEAGAVYAMRLAGGQQDSAGSAIRSDWVPVDLAAVPELTGTDLGAPDALGNTAAVERVANPDNLKFSESMRTLFIGEDSDMHVNNFLWAYDVDTKQLSRLLSCPMGAESTGLHAVDDLNGFAYVLSNFQHAGDYPRGVPAEVRARVDPLIDAHYDRKRAAAVGYLALAGPAT